MHRHETREQTRLPGAEAERIRLRSGAAVTFRTAVAEDEPALRAFLGDLCLEARRLRFFSGAVNLTTAAHLAAATGSDRFGLIAHDEAGAIVGHALFVKLSETCAEVAVEVADRLHGDGLGTILIERLAAIAEAHGISQFVAEVLPENRAMLEVFRDGFDAHMSLHDGIDRVEFPTAEWRFVRARLAGSQGEGEVPSTAPLIRPRLSV
jgi:GNAT superfamily N-acetyltransferase